MKSRSTATGLRTIQFHRGNPERTDVKVDADGEISKVDQKSGEKPDDENNLLNELPAGDGDKNRPSEDHISAQ